jgi:hypothetical protein
LSEVRHAGSAKGIAKKWQQRTGAYRQGEKDKAE